MIIYKLEIKGKWCDNKMSIGTRIKQRREELGLTQPTLAKMVGVSKGAIGNYESEVSSPNEPILIKLFDALQCDANFLYQDYIDINTGSNDFNVSDHEKDVIRAYRKQSPTVQAAIDRMLEIESPAEEKQAKKIG